MSGRKRLILSLLIGLASTVAVTWACVTLPRPSLRTEYYLSHADGPRWFVSVWTRLGVTRVGHVPDNGMWADQGAALQAGAIPHWSRARHRPPPDEFSDPDQPWTLEMGYGWPMRSGVSMLRNYVEAGRTWDAVSGIRTPDDGSGRPVSFNVFPTTPIWSGFAINTACYASIAYLLLFMPGSVRRVLRKRRGLCVQCTYPVRDGTCPECGTGVR